MKVGIRSECNSAKNVLDYKQLITFVTAGVFVLIPRKIYKVHSLCFVFWNYVRTKVHLEWDLEDEIPLALAVNPV